jgi:hypothetical protein
MSRTAPTLRPNAAAVVRCRVESGGEALGRHSDFPGLPPTAVAQALSRLARAGEIERLSRGVYYRGRTTPFGPSRPDPVAVRGLAAGKATFHPAGLAAAALLGLTTQAGRREDVATAAGSLPRRLLGVDVAVRTRRPAAWNGLTSDEAAIFDFLRSRGRTGELDPAATFRRFEELLRVKGRARRLVAAAASEPPRVHAMLGAILERARLDVSLQRRLHGSLNPLSRFDFGVFSSLPTAAAWQATAKR